MLSKGDFEDLYVTGYDTPEGYAIAKDGKQYYSFFRPRTGEAKLSCADSSPANIKSATTPKEETWGPWKQRLMASRK
jgi:hypothetical protein